MADNSAEIVQYEGGKEPTDPEVYWNQYALSGSEYEAHKAEMLRVFAVPTTVSSLNGDAGKRIVFPHVHPVAPLVRITICENLNPPRATFTTGYPSSLSSSHLPFHCIGPPHQCFVNWSNEGVLVFTNNEKFTSDKRYTLQKSN